MSPKISRRDLHLNRFQIIFNMVHTSLLANNGYPLSQTVVWKELQNSLVDSLRIFTRTRLVSFASQRHVGINRRSQTEKTGIATAGYELEKKNTRCIPWFHTPDRQPDDFQYKYAFPLIFHSSFSNRMLDALQTRSLTRPR